MTARTRATGPGIGNLRDLFAERDVFATLKACGRGVVLTAILFWPVVVFAVDVLTRAAG